MKKKIMLLVVSLIIVLSVVLSGCTGPGIHDDKEWKELRDPTNPDKLFYDVSLPNFDSLGVGVSNANADGWYTVLIDNFNGTGLNQDITAIAPELLVGNAAPEIWTYSPHDVRALPDNNGPAKNTSYWCPDMVKVNNGKVEIRTEIRSNHSCPSGKCPAEGRFTGGIETRQSEGESKYLFAQAFGYFEATVKFPKSEGLWSAFWLQTDSMRNLANEGVDGTEIDVYESAFIKNPKRMGHALLWNSYNTPFSKVDDAILDSGKNLYDGYHTFGLKWTPEYYVFYIDGVATWATNGGGVSKVEEFLRLTVEVDTGDGWGPHGQKIGKFKNKNTDTFYIDQVRVYQNANWAQYELTNKF